MSVKRAVIALAIAASVCAGAPWGARASAQTLSSGGIEGVVRDSAGRALRGTSITLVDVASGAARMTTADANGRYRFPLLNPGDYDVVVEDVGFRPVRVTGVALDAGERLDVNATLAAVAGPVTSGEVVRYGGGEHVVAGAAEALTGSLLSSLPNDRRDLAQVARLSSTLGPDLAAEGLPPAYTGLALDGMPFQVAQHPASPGAGIDPVLPLSSISLASFLGAPADAQWGGATGGILAVQTRRGTAGTQLHAFGRWSVPGLASSSFTRGLTFNDGDGGLVLTTPLVHDSAFLAVGVEGRHSERPLAALWANGSGADLLTVARDSFGVDLGSYARPRVARTNAVSAFARLDWQASATQGVDARVVVTRIPFADDGQAALVPLGAVPTYDGTDVIASAGLRSILGERTANELRLGFDASNRTFGTADSLSYAAPLAILALPGLGFGAGPATSGQFGNASVRLRETLLHDMGAHHLRIGLDGSSTSYKEDYRYGAAGVFLFGGVSDFARGQGLFVQRTGPAPDARFSIVHYALFAEDDWAPAPGLDLLLGVRGEREQLPSGAIARDTQWLSLTGIANDAVPKSKMRFSPRLSLRWDVQDQHAWIVNAAATLSEDGTDPAALGEVITQDGTTRVHRALGLLGPWPNVPGVTLAPDVGPVLTMLAPGFRPPRTARFSGGISRRLGDAATLDISGTYRHTEFLPTRTDLNLVASPSGKDQYGRPVYGQLQQVGSLIAVVPGTDRRFAGVDAAWALSSSAHSNYYGATVALRGRLRGADLLASYTYSAARDNWSSGWTAPASAFLTSGLGAVAPDAPADFDVPNRLVLGAGVRGPFGTHLAALYRYRSGLPFTPALAPGVDANADGTAGNDPAFVDSALPGMSALLSRWSCVSSQQGHFAARNSCRAPGVHSLDMRAALDLFRFGQGEVQITVDGLGLIQSDTGILDTALLQIDPAGKLAGDNLPLAVNPRFGTVVGSQAPGRIVRVGLSFNW